MTPTTKLHGFFTKFVNRLTSSGKGPAGNPHNPDLRSSDSNFASWTNGRRHAANDHDDNRTEGTPMRRTMTIALATMAAAATLLVDAVV
ncbi:MULTISPECIES: hypothetical protein [Bifidobacterium]|uniref:hypothetical protein n=1 Tax=Bifidobacterium TaxID=1678 RepID=UPI0024ACB7EE|nr:MULTISPECIES: hypothetical protein [Bifidobacterium]MBS5401922.1 hypothetical protein [Bifidobacterium sp.]